MAHKYVLCNDNGYKEWQLIELSEDEYVITDRCPSCVDLSALAKLLIDGRPS